MDSKNPGDSNNNDATVAFDSLSHPSRHASGSDGTSDDLEDLKPGKTFGRSPADAACSSGDGDSYRYISHNHLSSSSSGGGSGTATITTVGTADTVSGQQPGLQYQDEEKESAGPASLQSTEVSALRCYICGVYCSQSTELKQHLAFHLEDKPFKCIECGKPFQARSNLLLHQRAAHGLVSQMPDTSLGVSSEPAVASEGPSQPHHMYMANHSADTADRGVVKVAEMPTGEAGKFAPTGSSPRQAVPVEGNGGGGQSDASLGSFYGQCADSLPLSGPAMPHAERLRDEEEDKEEEPKAQAKDDIHEFTIKYPSMFPGLKHQISIKNETVLVTRIDGVTKSTGQKASLFKCHMCGKIFNYLSKLQCHLSLHFERSLNVYICNLCDNAFQFKTQLLQHLRRRHGLNLTGKGEIAGSANVGNFSSALYRLSSDEDPFASNLGLLTDESEDMQYEDDEGTTPVSKANSGPAVKEKGNEKVEPDSALIEQAKPKMETDSLWSKEESLAGFPFGLYSYDSLYKRSNGLYICQFCNKGFDRLFSLNRHERVHTGFKPCCCKYCGRGFSEPRNLRHHMIRFHSDGNTAHMLKKLRGLCPSPVSQSRASQRLAYITPDDIAKSEVEGSEEVGQEDESMSYVTEPSSQVSSPRVKAVHTPQQADDVVSPPVNQSEESQSTSTTELANEIREKEKLDEDVMVVIPSEPPATEGKEEEAVTPKSEASENSSWSDNLSDGEEFGGSQEGGAIVSAPIRSLIGHQQYSRSMSKRKSSLSTCTTPPTPAEDKPNGQLTPQERASSRSAMGGNGSVSTPNTNFSPQPPLPSLPDLKPPLQPPHMPPLSLSLPFNPLSISTYMNPALPGLMPPSLISPLSQAAFLAQQGLTSPSMVGNPLSFLAPLPTSVAGNASSTPQASTAAGTAGNQPATATAEPGNHNNGKDPTLPNNTSPGLDSQRLAHVGHSRRRSSENDNTSSSSSRGLEDLQNWMHKGSGSGRGSSLSRSHTSRLYVVRQPVNREDACKPIVMPDGRTVYRCSYCNKDFCTFSDVNRHMDFHEGRQPGPNSAAGRWEDIRPYKCKFCDYYARTNSQLKVHMMRHQGIREFHCKLCNYKGVTQSDLNRHMKSQIHMMKAQNECKHCGEGFVSPKNLERHYHEKHFSQYEKLGGCTVSKPPQQRLPPVPQQHVETFHQRYEKLMASAAAGALRSTSVDKA